MQIRTGLHSQLSEVSGKKHRYFKVEWSGPGTLQDQSCASWGWGQVSNSSEQSSWQRSSHAGASGLWGGCRQGASAISACETFQVLRPHRRPAHEQGGVRVVPPGSSNHQGQITAFVHGPRRCPSAGVWHTAVMRVGHKQSLHKIVSSSGWCWKNLCQDTSIVFMYSSKILQQNDHLQALLQDIMVFLTFHSQWASFSKFSFIPLHFFT